MSNNLRLRNEKSHAESATEHSLIWSDITDTPRIRTAEEVEALIERLTHNLDERTANREHMTDAVSTLRRIRAARSRYLRRR